MSVNEVKLSKAARPFAVLGTSSNPNSKTFCIGDEDHTLGNAVRHVLVTDGTHRHGVTFAGYSVPHPSEPVVHIRVQTSHDNESSPTVPAIVALQSACQTLSDQCDHVLDVLEAVLPHVKDDRIQIEQALMEEEYEEDEEGQQQQRQPTDRMDEDE